MIWIHYIWLHLYMTCRICQILPKWYKSESCRNRHILSISCCHYSAHLYEGQLTRSAHLGDICHYSAHTYQLLSLQYIPKINWCHYKLKAQNYTMNKIRGNTQCKYSAWKQYTNAVDRCSTAMRDNWQRREEWPGGTLAKSCNATDLTWDPILSS